jgi:hypothetical protein
MPNSSTPKAPRWISSLIADIMQLLVASNPAFDQETNYLNLLVTINQVLDLSRLNLGSESDILEQLRRLNSQGDKRSNAVVGLALASLPPTIGARQSIESFEDLVFSWKPLSESNPSTLEVIVLAILSDIVRFPMPLLITWQDLDIEARVIVAFEMVQNRNLEGAQAILEQSLEEVEKKYGTQSPEIFITTAELLHCYNVLGVKKGERNISQMVSSRLSESRWSGVFGYQSLLIQYVDHLIGLGEYSEAEEWMERVLKDSSTSPPTTSMVALRMLKARRRQTKAWLDNCTPNCIKLLIKSFPGLSNSLRFEAIDEILGNIYLVNMKDREQMRYAAEIIIDLTDRVAELPSAWQSRYPMFESHMQSLDRYGRAFSQRIGLYEAAEKNTDGSDTAQLVSAPLQAQTTSVSVEALNTSWETLFRTTSQKLEWVISWPLGFGKQISALGWAGIGLVDMDWVTYRWQEMALELLIGEKHASRLMKRATIDRRGSIILQSIPTNNAGKDEVESATLNADYSVLMPASAALTLGTSKLKMLQYENARRPRKLQFSDCDGSDFVSVKFGRRPKKELSSDEKDVYASCAFRVLYGKITFALRRVRRL